MSSRTLKPSHIRSHLRHSYVIVVVCELRIWFVASKTCVVVVIFDCGIQTCFDCGDTEPSRPAFYDVDDSDDDEVVALPRTKREEKEPKLSWASTSRPALPRRRSTLGKEKEKDGASWEQKDKEYRQQIAELKGTIRELRGRLEEEKVKSQAHGPASSQMGVLSGQTSSFLPPRTFPLSFPLHYKLIGYQ